MNKKTFFTNAFVVTFISILVLSGCVNDKVFPPDVEPVDTTDTTKDTTQDSTVTDPCDTLNVTYSGDIEPIINTECATSPSCHGSGSVNGPFTSYNGVKQKVDNGSFEQRVLVQKNMPPSGPLSNSELEKIQCWLDDGAPDN